MCTKSSQKSAKKTFFYIHKNIVTKKLGGKNVQSNFSRNSTKSADKKCWEKIVQIIGKKGFYIHTNIVSKKFEEKTRKNNFFRNTPIERAKNVRKKSSQKVRKNVFYIHTNIVTKNGGKKRETTFPETLE